MIAFATIPLTCWLCAWLAKPGKPLRGNEIQELVYGRLLGRQQRLTLLAVIVTGALLLLLIAQIPRQIDANLAAVRGAGADCAAQFSEVNPQLGPSPCYRLQAGGVWVQETRQSDGSWRPVATLAAPIALEDTIHGRKP